MTVVSNQFVKVLRYIFTIFFNVLPFVGEDKTNTLNSPFLFSAGWNGLAFFKANIQQL